MCAALLTSGCGDSGKDSHNNDTVADAGDLPDVANGGESDSEGGAGEPDTSAPPEHTLRYSRQIYEGGGEWDGRELILDDTLYIAFTRSLWRFDGTADGSELVKDVKLRFPGVHSGQILSFGTDDPLARPPVYHLWRSDGTAEGTVKFGEEPPFPGIFAELGEISFVFSWRNFGKPMVPQQVQRNSPISTTAGARASY